MPAWFLSFGIALAAAITAEIASAGLAVYHYDLTSVYAENGLLEQSQVALLLLSGVMLLLASRKRGSPARLIPLFCALLCLGFILREIDVERTQSPAWVKWIGAGVGRDLLLTTALLAVLTYALRHLRYYWQASWQFLRSLPARLFLLGGSLLVIGDLSESLDDVIKHSKFFEESIELYGYAMIALAAAATLTRLPKPNAPVVDKKSDIPHTSHVDRSEPFLSQPTQPPDTKLGA